MDANSYYPSMNLHDIYSSEGPQGLSHLAKQVGTASKYLYQCATGRKSPGPKLVHKLVSADPRLTYVDLRPDIYPPTQGDAPPQAQGSERESA